MLGPWLSLSLLACGGAPPAPSQLCVVRHAEAFKNLDPAPAGLSPEQLDALTPRGEEQARRAGAALPAGVERVLTSPAGRARETAAWLGPWTPEVEPALRPLDGDLPWSERERAWAAGEDPRPPGGESLADGQARARALLDRLRAALPPGRHAVVVTHGDLGPVLLGELRGTPLLARPTRDALPGGGVVCLPL